MTMDDLEGRQAFITGGASGIGLGIARAFVEVGMEVTIADLRQDHIDTALALFDSLQQGRKVTARVLDVTDRSSFARLTDEAFARHGRIDVLVNNAGVGIEGPVRDATFADWDWGLGVNLGGAVNGLVNFLPRMTAQGNGGHIVTVSSLSALTPTPRNGVIYATTKAALLAMTEAMREELADYSIGVSVLMPGPYKTNIREAGQNRPERFRAASGFAEVETRLANRQDMPNWGDPLDAGRLVVEAIRHNRLYVITHGEFKGWAETRFAEILGAYPPCDPALLACMGRRRPPRTPE